MKKNFGIFKRYTLLCIIFICLLVVGIGLTKAWYITPERHLNRAMRLMEENQFAKALPHFMLATKSNKVFVKANSAYNLALLLHHGADGVEQNIPKAARYYEIAANNGVIQAQYVLALLYDAGDKIPEDRSKALHYMEQAAEMMPEAQYAIGVWIERGYYGEPNMDQAVEFYTKAAKAGIPNAMKSLISIYHGGFGKFPKNIQQEQYWRHQLELNQKKNDVLS